MGGHIMIHQKELKECYEAGKTIVFKYRRMYQIKLFTNYKDNKSEYLLQEIEREYKNCGVPYTASGRYVIVTPEYAKRILVS
jgi:2-hydroxychromene-2-carboxylate isomerase